MKLTEKTAMKDIFALVELMTEDQCREASEWATKVLRKKWHELTIWEANECMQGDFAVIGVEGNDMLNCLASQYFWAWGFAQVFMPQYVKSCESLIVPPTIEEQEAAEGLISCSWYESQIVFTQKYFGLKDFNEAEKITLDQLLVARKAMYNEGMFQRKLFEIQRRKK